ncbi:SDR family NAD(P)-dependent oxidoreductase [Pseudonocardiaceae bacterium YIM PH 21723]|nr:SDR family NAD(P)-dependent oxidoreductase [Pseudonocardiaceae bacterium YIM PH 21723]
MSQHLALAGNPVVISGAASGIGRALAQRLSRLGSPVAITDWNEAGLKETAAGLTGNVLTHVLDVSDNEAQHEWAAQVREWLPGPLAGVFNNAGVGVMGSITGGNPEDDQWLDNINFHGVVYATRAFLPILLAQGSGAMVNTSSVWGLAGSPGGSAYSASKFAVRGFTESLRNELRGTEIRAITVHPGGVKTDIARNSRFTEEGAVSHEEVIKRYDALMRTTADKAAEIIHRGVDRGKARILVGPDAHLIDLLTRLTPTHYYSVLTKLLPSPKGK